MTSLSLDHGIRLIFEQIENKVIVPEIFQYRNRSNLLETLKFANFTIKKTQYNIFMSFHDKKERCVGTYDIQILICMQKHIYAFFVLF